MERQGRFLAPAAATPTAADGAQTWYCYDNTRATLASQGLTMRDMVHVNNFLQDLRDFGTFHRVHRHFFPESGPALVVTGFKAGAERAGSG